MSLLPDTTFEQRSPLYDDVRALVTPGFLAHSIDVNGVSFSLRSLGLGDFFMLRHRVGHKFEEDRWEAWMIASSVWMIDGQTVFGDEQALHRVYEMCRKLPRSARQVLFSVSMSLVHRLDKAVNLTEAYLYESESRYLWKAEGEKAVYHSWFGVRTGIALNPVQKLWLYYNRMEDEREAYNVSWTMAKFMIGPHAPKSINKLNQKDKKDEDNLAVKRKEIQDKGYYRYLGVLRDSKELEKDKTYQEFHVARSVEELQDQMRAWVSGDKDDHDRVVDAIKAKIRHERESQKAEEDRQRAELARLMAEEGMAGSSLQPLSPEVAEEVLGRLRARQVNPGARKVFQDDGHNSAYEKYIKNNPDVGVLRVDEDGTVMESAGNLDEKTQQILLDMISKKDTKRDLTSEIENLKPTIKYEG